MLDTHLLQTARDKALNELLAQRTADGHWEGRLSSSAVSTATAVSALAIASTPSAARGDREQAAEGDAALIRQGIARLAHDQNPDGGWGDTDKSHSNIAATMLAVAAIHLAGRKAELASPLERAFAYIERSGFLDALRRRYGQDRTFAAPILANYAMAGLVAWSQVPVLPFELACVPQPLYRFAGLPVVSYAIPALVAIGQVRHAYQRPRSPLARLIRRVASGPSLRVIRRMQPESGGYLEAVPLTSFVVMSLAASGRRTHPVVQQGLRFLRDSARPDGSWPIDTNLATWNTSLALNALAECGCDLASSANLDWLLGCQHGVRHPFTGAAPGGWGWTDLSGAVPDADDTAGALIALLHWHQSAGCSDQDRRRIESAAERGVAWLLGLQNADGGWPTFCRGWGRLPFDRSGADLTAHALRALHAWRHGSAHNRRIATALKRGWSYLQSSQRPDGSWVPLWFGNQDHPAEENPVFGTARVLAACTQLQRGDTAAARRGFQWLVNAQRPDGGWSGGAMAGKDSASSVEETALAVEALLGPKGGNAWTSAAARGLQWLVDAVLADRHRESSPIGFYFAKLWYYESQYPLTFTVSALGRAVARLGSRTTITH